MKPLYRKSQTTSIKTRGQIIYITCCLNNVYTCSVIWAGLEVIIIVCSVTSYDNFIGNYSGMYAGKIYIRTETKKQLMIEGVYEVFNYVPALGYDALYN